MRLLGALEAKGRGQVLVLPVSKVGVGERPHQIVITSGVSRSTEIDADRSR